jgi:uncharacterized protein (TIGR02600 family)
MNTSQPQKKARNTKGLALVMVVSMLALLTVLTIAIFSLAQNERAASDQHSQQEMARGIADTGINLVMSQIWQGTKQDATVGGRELWASQPGAIRKYRANGGFHSGYKLYSSSSMVVAGDEKQMIEDGAPYNWNTMPARFVDLNDPVVRPPVTGTTEPTVYFPIIDPRAYVMGSESSSTNPNVEGFWYGTKGLAGGDNIFGVKPASNPDDITARLAMPVEWLYLLKDGTVGALNAANEFVKPDGTPLRDDEAVLNPIVGRIAFWTDDECAKLNINVASEPTYWTTPTFMHDRDLWWAYYQPTTYEYQRYPGHPATVALSTVFFPNQDMDIYGKTDGSADYQKIIQRKESIYAMAPKVNLGGSKVGTVAYWKFVDNYQGYKDTMYNKYVDLTAAMKERLYASVDELYFAQTMGATNTRKSNMFVDNSGNESTNSLFSRPTEKYSQDKISLERARFFLTAQSRMPEVNMFGTPRVAIWPIADEGGIEYEAGRKTSGSTGNQYRTGYDQLIAFCSSMGKPGASNIGDKSYFFRRKCAYSDSVDVGLPRNQKLLSYLGSLLQQQLPGGASFAQKYPNDYQQILVEIFDYIRMTNLYDGFLCPTRETLQQSGSLYDMNASRYAPPSYAATGEITADGNIYRNRPTTFRTYTYDRASENTTTRGGSLDPKSERVVERNFPGHGMVVPSRYNGYKGFGRFVTLSEVGFQFICTADGDTDKGSATDYVITGAKFPAGHPKAGQFIYQKGTKKSGGRTALKIIRETGAQAGPADPEVIKGNSAETWTGKDENQFWYSNYPPEPSRETMESYGVDMDADESNPNSVFNHPGCKPENWNATLEPQQPPLTPGQRRVQGTFVMEFAMISAGFTELNPEFTVVVEGLYNTKLNAQDLYDTGSRAPIIWKSPDRVYDKTDCRPIGGNISMHAMSNGRRTSQHGMLTMAADFGYDLSAAGSGDPHKGCANFDFATRYLTIDVGTNKMRFTGAPLTIKVYSSHKTTNDNLVQTYQVNLPDKDLPVPQLVILSADRNYEKASNGTVTINEAVDACHWWALNYSGALNRYSGVWNGRFWDISPTSDPADAVRTRGRFYQNGGNDRSSHLWIPRGGAILWAYEAIDNGSFSNPLLNPSDPAEDNPVAGTRFYGVTLSDTSKSDILPENDGKKPRNCRGTDVLFTMVPMHGDTRLIAAMDTVPASLWVEHPQVKNLGGAARTPDGQTAAAPHGPYVQQVAHSLSRYNSGSDAGYDRGQAANRLVPNAAYHSARTPDVPSMSTASDAAAKYGDFDNAGFAGLRDGAYINKPDEGDAAVTFHAYGDNNTQTVRLANAYLATWDYGWLFSDPGESFMTPNRMLPSAGMFGSLSTGVREGVPWRTLLFRPQTRASLATTKLKDHPGAASWQGGRDPADHYIMDLFWMPIVEPYAISEPFSTAGKVNINYQIVPFTHIRRATGVHAVLKGEMIKAVPVSDAPNYNVMPGSTKFLENDGYTYRQPWTDLGKNQVSGANLKKWHRLIDVEKRPSPDLAQVTGTLSQFENRFNFVVNGTEPDMAPPKEKAGLFRSASQICEVHLIPQKVSGGDGADTGGGTSYKVSEMSASFWATRRLTGDNVRERPYANIYGKITTQSNTFRVHYRAQALKKARSSNRIKFDPEVDAVLNDYRGSALIERRIDPADSRIPDYGASLNPTSLPPLDDFYRFRVLEMKRFMP